MEGVSVWAALVLGFAFERAQMFMCAANMNQMPPFNGFGAIENVLRRVALAPMAYRVLVPWFVGVWEWVVSLLKAGEPGGVVQPGGVKGGLASRVFAYELVRWLLVAWAFWAVGRGWGMGVLLWVVLLLLLTVRYDYWDWAVEMAGVGLAMAGGQLDLWVVCAGAGLWGLSRETWVLAPVIYVLQTGDLAGGGAVLAAGGLGWLAARWWGGKKRLYCKRFMIRENLTEVRKILRVVPFFYGETLVSIVLCGLGLAGAIVQVVEGGGWSGVVVVGAICGAGWTMARAEETRVFSAVLPWAAMLLERWF